MYLSSRTFVTILVGSVLFSSEAAYSAAAPDQADSAYLRQVRAIATAELNAPNPVGLAFSSQENAFLVFPKQKPGQSRAGGSTLMLLSLLEDLAGSMSTPGWVSDPLNMTFDDDTDSLLFLDQDTGTLVELPASSGPGVPRFTAPQLGLKTPQGLTLDAASGRLFILDAAGPHILAVTPAGEARKIPLNFLRGPKLRGIAFNPNNGHLYVLSPVKQELYELTETGQLVATADLTATELADPQGMVFAPSGDLTEDPTIMSLYIADSGRGAGRGRGNVGGQIIELSLTEPALSTQSQSPAASRSAPSAQLQSSTVASLVRIIDTSRWSPPSPDPSGITYLPASDTLLVTDSEVEEMPPYFVGKNVFESTTAGILVRTHSTTAFTNEPTGVAVNSNNSHLFFCDDDKDNIDVVNLGADRQWTAGDIVTSFDTRPFNSVDPEGITFGQGDLFVADGTNSEVYRVRPGNNGIFDGVPPTGDDQVTHFDTLGIGIRDPSGIGFNGDNGTLYIINEDGDLVETTIDGTVVRVIDIFSLRARRVDDIGYAPGSQNPAVKNLYVVARGVDNNADPNENDGKIYEVTLQAVPPPANLLLNPSFEDVNSNGRPDGWTNNSRFTRSNAVAAVDGSFIGRHFATDNFGYAIHQVVNNISAGTTYRFSGRVNIPATSDSFTFQLQVRWRNASNSIIRSDTIKSYTTATSGWDEATRSMVAPAGATNAVVRMAVSSLNATIYVDAFEFGP